MKSLRLLLIFVLTSYCASAQTTALWLPSPAPADQPYLKHFHAFALDARTLKTQLWAAPLEHSTTPTQLTLPLADGKIYTFNAWYAPTMAPELAAKYPEIKSFLVADPQNPAINGRVDYSPQGFHALIFTPEGTVYIDPIKNQSDVYAVYYKQDYSNPAKRQDWNCAVENTKTTAQTVKKNDVLPPANPSPEFVHGETLRTYRLALACTGEYAAAVNATTKPQVLAAMNTSVNRVNALYERDIAVRLLLIANTDTLIFFNSTTDPYTNNNGSTMLGQNQSTVSSRIGSANYDIGHVFSTGGGGVANLGCVCTNADKARGVTGSSDPVGDPFDIDFVAHEMGHQFDGNHTFNNSCSGNRNSGTAVEPASGSTIMAYAGVCPPDLQLHSDDHFSAMSLNEITSFITSSGGTCSVQSATANAAPIVNAGANYTIPKSTPFYLKGTATDNNPNQTLTYNWEQMDIGPQTAWNAPTGNAPIFRSFPSENTGYREFPKRSNTLSNTVTIGEILPSYARSLVMRLTVKDNRAGAGAFGFDTTKIIVANSGPFSITAPNTATTWAGGSIQTITWNVNGTNTAPVNCQNVKILLSRNAGQTFTDTLLITTPNDGTESIIVPNLSVIQARIMITGINNVFFDINNANFAITQSANANYGVFTQPQTVCAGNNITSQVIITKIGNFTDSVSLALSNVPPGITATLNKTTLLPLDTVLISIQTNNTVAQNAYVLTLTSTTPSGNNRTTNINLNVLSNNLGSIALNTPANNATNLGGLLAYQWAGIAGSSYQLQIATDTLFSAASLVLNRQNLATNSLLSGIAGNPNATYFWRVRPTSSCGLGVYSNSYKFSTSSESCKTYNRTTTSTINFPSGFPAVLTSTIQVSDSLRVQDVNIYLKGNHSRIKDLEATLISPSGTQVVLFKNNCLNVANFDIKFDDDATIITIPCPPISTANVRPKNALTAFNGEWATGVWTLKLVDSVGLGSQNANLQNWNLGICASCFGGITLNSTPVDSTLCAGNLVQLTARASSSAPFTYQWLRNNAPIFNANTNSYAAYQTGTYACVATNGCGSDTSGISNISITPLPLPTITQIADSLVTQAAAAYQWYKFALPIPGATGRSYRPSSNGEYQVVSTVNNCASIISDTYFFFMAALKDLNLNKPVLYPNPTDKILNIFLPRVLNSENLMVYNILGEVVYAQYKLSDPNILLDVEKWQAGVYFVKIGEFSSKFIVE